MIPKIIHQTWYKKDLPTPIQVSIDNMMRLNKDYDYYLYDDIEMKNFVHDNYDEKIIKAFDSIEIGAMKADLWRYLVLYKFGGVYLDIDSLIFADLSNLITDDRAIITREGNFNLFVQWMLIFPKNHPLLKICIEKCVDNIMGSTKQDVTKMTGPNVFSDSIRQFTHDELIYSKSDDEINTQIQDKKLRVYSFDYRGFAHYYHPNRDLLYTDKVYWRDEQRIKYGI